MIIAWKKGEMELWFWNVTFEFDFLKLVYMFDSNLKENQNI